MRQPRHFNAIQSAGDYSEAYYTHGLAVQTAEAAAEYLHRHIRRELRTSEGQGKRYSWGYPAIPELEDHAKIFSLLPVGRDLNMELSPAFQLIPEQSTAAIIVHHPDAKYYNVGVSQSGTTLGKLRLEGSYFKGIIETMNKRRDSTTGFPRVPSWPMVRWAQCCINHGIELKTCFDELNLTEPDKHPGHSQRIYRGWSPDHRNQYLWG